MSTVAEIVAEMRAAVTPADRRRITAWADALAAATAAPAPPAVRDDYDDGGPAFPQWASSREEGMTLREYFAGQALAGMLSNQVSGRARPEVATPDLLAVAAYRYADALLAARAQPPPEAQP